MNDDILKLHDALMTLVAFFNQPKRDDILLREAGLSLDRALFPLLVRIERLGPLGIVELAGQVGRDYSTVSRQVSKLESLALVARKSNADDRRSTEITVTAKGKKMTVALDAARERLMGPPWLKWTEKDRKLFVYFLCRFNHDLAAHADIKSQKCKKTQTNVARIK